MIESKMKVKNCNRHRQLFRPGLVPSARLVAELRSKAIGWLTDRLLNVHGSDDLRWIHKSKCLRIGRCRMQNAWQPTVVKKQEYHVVVAIRRLRTDEHSRAENTWPNHVKNKQHIGSKLKTYDQKNLYEIKYNDAKKPETQKLPTVINASAAVTLLEQRPEKIQALSGIRTHDLCDASAVLLMDKINFTLLYSGQV